jgi:hypothetical protein
MYVIVLILKQIGDLQDFSEPFFKHLSFSSCLFVYPSYFTIHQCYHHSERET